VADHGHPGPSSLPRRPGEVVSGKDKPR
jgi:hypothetical protein